MMKTVIVQNGNIINVGDWDYQIVDVDGEQLVQNPLPDGAIIEERDMEYNEENGWREVGFVSLPTEIEKVQQENETLKGEITNLQGAVDFIIMNY